MKKRPVRGRFNVKYVVNPKTGCWEWTAYRNRYGYGQFCIDGRMMKAHRVAYELYRGNIPEGLQIDHLCRVRHCVNPDHLEPVTAQENHRRGESGVKNKQKTHCPHGHPYAGDNLQIRSCGGRTCRKCSKRRGRERRARQAVSKR